MSTAEIAYGILAMLQPLTGDSGSGNVTVQAAGADTTMPLNAFGVPVITSDDGMKFLDWDRPIRTVETKLATAAGVSVACRTNLGGARSNLPAGTPIRWFPAIAGIQEQSVVTAGGIVGAIEPLEDHALRALVWSQDLPAQGPIHEEIIRAATSRFPAAVLYTTGTGPDELMAATSTQRTDRWGLVIIVEDQRGHHTRSRVAFTLEELASGLLSNRSNVVIPGAGATPHQAMVVSQPGIKIVGRRQRQIVANFYALEVTFETHRAFESLEPTSGLFTDWVRTRYDFVTTQAETGAHPSTLGVIGGALYPQP